MKTNNNIPAYRFQGYTDAWELRKLGELGTLKNGMNFSKDAMGIGFPFINLQNIFGKNIVDVSQLGLAKASSVQLKNYNLQKGDVLFVRSSVKLEGVGEAAIVPKNLENTTYSGFIIRYRDSFGLDYNFKRFVFGTSNIRNQIMSQATDSANKNISQQVLTELDILVPTLPEQSAIGTFFSTLDQQITLHQRKLDTLKEQKKTYLKLLFPAKGQTKPTLRFQGFEDDWKEVKLEDVVEKSGSGGTPKSTNKSYYGGNIPFLSITDITQSGKYITNTEKTLTELGLENSSAWIVPKGAISLAMYASVGKLAILKTDVATSQAFFNMVFSNEIVRDYVYFILDKAQLFNEWLPLISTGTQGNLNAQK
ncbi:TPA: restriction endonuclease subunit S, partial [Streptococcus suis]